MLNKLEAIDRWIVASVNSWHNPFLDELMWVFSAKLTWIPLYLLLIYLFYRKTNFRMSVIFVLCALAVVALTDQFSVHLFKDVFLRYRPSHHTELTEKLHFYKLENGDFYKGGMYGFVSSHAANFFGVCLFAALALRQYYKWVVVFLLGIASIVSFSRIYLGVHYLSDVLAGGILGALIAFLVFRYIYTFVSVNKQEKR